jgi:hypothetical protein
MLLCLQKGFQYLNTIFKVVDLFLLKQLFELFFFLEVRSLHIITQVGYR